MFQDQPSWYLAQQLPTTSGTPRQYLRYPKVTATYPLVPAPNPPPPTFMGPARL